MFIRISADEYINSDEIVHIKAVDDLTCLVSTESGIYTAQMPVSTLLAIIKGQEPQQNKELNVLEEMNKKIGELPIFAG